MFAGRDKSPMDEFLPGWRELPEVTRLQGKASSPQEESKVDKSLVQAFRSKMVQLGFAHYDEVDPVIRNDRNVPMYHLLFFSHHKIGATIWKKIKRIEPGGQRKLF